MYIYKPLGDSAFLIKLGDTISAELNKEMQNFVLQINKSGIKGLIELVPAYNELTLYYNPLEIDFKVLLAILKHIELNTLTLEHKSSDTVYIPVCYSAPYAPDIDYVAMTNGISHQQVIELHTAPLYLVYMLGFTPGFCYLGGLNELLYTPRKAIPEQFIEAGSVGIAGNQTGIYPIDSPGGWQIIGKTPVKLFSHARKHEFLIEAGNYIQFYSISEQEFKLIKELDDQGKYKLRKEKQNV
jgi:inhibitor of KinA